MDDSFVVIINGKKHPYGCSCHAGAINLEEEIPLNPPRFPGSRKQRSHGSKRVLEKLLLKYDSICHLCYKYVEPKDASADHIIPRADGGKNTFENLALSHNSCNHNRGSMSVEKYREFYRYRMDHGHWPQEYRDLKKKMGVGNG